MGSAAERCGGDRPVTREAQDAFAAESYRRAQRAAAEGLFTELVPITVKDRRGADVVIASDEEPARVDFDRLATLKPSFAAGGTITAANASTLADGAAAVVVADAAVAA